MVGERQSDEGSDDAHRHQGAGQGSCVSHPVAEVPQKMAEPRGPATKASPKAYNPMIVPIMEAKMTRRRCFGVSPGGGGRGRSTMGDMAPTFPGR